MALDAGLRVSYPRAPDTPLLAREAGPVGPRPPKLLDRVREAIRLRVQDLDFAMNQIVVRDGKGAKDRLTMLPAMAKAALARHLQSVKRQHEADLAHGAGWVELPSALARKYPNAAREWVWHTGCSPPPGSTSTELWASAAAITCTKPCSSAP